MWELLGLTRSDEIVFRHETLSSDADVSEAARATGLSEDIVEESRSRLLEKGLLRESPGGEVAPVLSGPSVIAEQLRGELEAEYASKRRAVAIFQTELTRLINEKMLAETHIPDSGLRVLRLQDPQTASLKLVELTRCARHEVMQAERTFRDPPVNEKDVVQAAELHALGRGVQVRTIYPPAELARPRVRQRVWRKLDAGAAVRSATIPAPSRLFIFDRSIAMLVDGDLSSGADTMLIHEAALVRSFMSLFESWWTYARDAQSFLSGCTEGEITPEEKITIRLLSDGLKDEAIAKRLGVSVRTVRRKISDILQKLPADSRFQAGVIAVRRGWL